MSPGVCHEGMVDDDISLRTRFALDLGTGAESDSSVSNIKIS